MSLEEFKVIFYWEYYHRVLARLIGIFFLIPMIYFYISKKIKKEYMNICYLIFFLIVLQGIIGWFMVKSGLVNVTTVSHYRLSIHLITAIIIISCIFWLIRNIISNKNKIFFKFSIKNSIYQLCIILIYIQIMIGAFVSGLDAGQIYQTWPMMGDNFIPDDLYSQKMINVTDFNNHSLVQFYHRNLAYILVLYILFLTITIYKNKSVHLYNPIKIMLLFLFFQILLGIFTLISGLNIYLASAHQITSILLVFSALNLYFLKVK